jgi:hypothetical protein
VCRLPALLLQLHFSSAQAKLSSSSSNQWATAQSMPHYHRLLRLQLLLQLLLQLAVAELEGVGHCCSGWKSEI